MKIVAAVPMMMPTNNARERSRSVPAPRRPAPINRIAATGRTATIMVLMERTRVWLIARLTSSPNVRRVDVVISAVFSRILSNTTTVSYSE
ncbi:hypothetical protein D3C73_1345340 [compost metagenome]